MTVRPWRRVAPALFVAALAAGTTGLATAQASGNAVAHPAGTAATEPSTGRWSTDGTIDRVKTAAKAAARAKASAAGAASKRPGVVRGAPVQSRPRVVAQPDGTKITIRGRGDAARHWTETSQGFAVVRDARGTWRFATGVDARGQLVASVAAPAVGRTGVGPAAAARIRPTRDLLTGVAAPRPNLGFAGTQKTLVILASFADQPSVGSTAAEWSSKFFGASDSVRSFYKTASYNLLDVAPATETNGTAGDGVVGWVNLGINHPNYAVNIDGRAHDLTKRAVQAADAYVDYASYDTNGDGRLTPNELHITVIAAGYEASFSSQCGPTVWGHRWAIGGAGVTAPVVDGKTVGADGYTQFGEFHCDATNTPGHMATIGIMAHEIGHDFGWPDLYDYDGSSEGVGEWSLMGAGSWGTTPDGTLYGDRPSLPDAWAKYAQGWTSPTEVVATTPVGVLDAATSSASYRLLANPGGADWSDPTPGTGEYFLVENRQQAGLDVDLPGCGIVVYHVDESQSDNTDDTRRLVDVEEADGLAGLDAPGYRGGPGDAWHGVSGHTAFTSTSTPNSRLNGGTVTPAAMTASGGCAASMPASLTGGTVTVTGPPNDDFAARQTVSGANGTVTGTNVDATAEVGEPDHAGQVATSSVWYHFTAPADGRLDLTTAGSAFDTTLGVYRGSSLASLVEVASNDDADLGAGVFTSAVQAVPVKAGTSVEIAVDGFDGASGAVQLGWTFTAGALDPTGTFAAVSPARLLDTRSGAPLGVNGVRTFAVSGHGGVPATGVDAVVLNVTAVGPTASGYATVYPAGAAQPVASNLNFTPANKAIANLVVVKVGAGGAVSILNRLGSTHFLADVVGWYATGTGTIGGRYTPTAPARLLDTRGDVPLGPGESGDLWVADGDVVPASARGVVMNVTATGTSTAGYLTIWPSGRPRPTTSNINWSAGMTVPNLVYSPLSGGTISIFNSAGNADVIVDVVGWFAYDGQLVYHPLAPKRVVDTRSGLGGMGATRLGAATTRTADLTGGTTTVPDAAAAIIVNTTVTQTSAGSYLTVWPGGTTRPTASNLNWTAGRTVPNLVATKVGAGGLTSVYNSTGSTHVLMDVFGWYGS